jgi:hypothetical protein
MFEILDSAYPLQQEFGDTTKKNWKAGPEKGGVREISRPSGKYSYANLFISPVRHEWN